MPKNKNSKKIFCYFFRQNKVFHFQADFFQKENFLHQIGLENKIS